MAEQRVVPPCITCCCGIGIGIGIGIEESYSANYLSLLTRAIIAGLELVVQRCSHDNMIGK